MIVYLCGFPGSIVRNPISDVAASPAPVRVPQIRTGASFVSIPFKTGCESGHSGSGRPFHTLVLGPVIVFRPCAAMPKTPHVEAIFGIAGACCDQIVRTSG